MKKIISLSILLALVVTWLTSSVHTWSTVDYSGVQAGCSDCQIGYAIKGFPLPAIKFISGGFTGGTNVPQVGIAVNFLIYFTIAVLITIFFLGVVRNEDVKRYWKLVAVVFVFALILYGISRFFDDYYDTWGSLKGIGNLPGSAVIHAV